jgi:isoleucyl-tRNA synthetase
MADAVVIGAGVMVASSAFHLARAGLRQVVVVEREVMTDWLVQAEGPFVVALDPVVTPALREEGLAREVVNRIQRSQRLGMHTTRNIAAQ